VEAGGGWVGGTTGEVPAADAAPPAPARAHRHLIETYFPNAYNGTCLELGAVDGALVSNTAALHTALGWRGLLIEASPDRYAQLMVNRPGDVCVNAAVCDESRMVHYVSSPAAGGPTVRGVWESMPASFRAHWHPNVNMNIKPLVPCLPLADVFDALGVQRVNFFSLDVEGVELAVLRTFDFGRVEFDVICVESDGNNREKDAAVVSLLEGAGYRHAPEVVAPLHNDWFVLERFHRTMSRSGSHSRELAGVAERGRRAEGRGGGRASRVGGRAAGRQGSRLYPRAGGTV